METKLKELLESIYDDGGKYIEEVGLDKALHDAIILVNNFRWHIASELLYCPDCGNNYYEQSISSENSDQICITCKVCGYCACGEDKYHAVLKWNLEERV